MSTSEAGDIPFSASHQRQPFKLLELPPELLSLLESENPPTLKLDPDTAAGSGNGGFAILSTEDKSLMYHVRQKNTSNPIHILAPTSIGNDASGGNGGDEEEKEMGVSSIAVIEDTLELYKVEKRVGGAGEKGASAGGSAAKNRWHEKFAKGRAK